MSMSDPVTDTATNTHDTRVATIRDTGMATTIHEATTFTVRHGDT